MKPLAGQRLLRSIASDARRRDRTKVEKQAPIKGFSVSANHEVLNCDEYAQTHGIYEEKTKEGAHSAGEAVGAGRRRQRSGRRGAAAGQPAAMRARGSGGRWRASHARWVSIYI